MDNTKKNITLTSDRDLSLKMAYGKAKRYLIENPYIKTGTVYVDSPTISDLFIITSGILKRCTQVEWADYFYNYLNPREIEIKKPVKRYILT